MNRVLYLTDKLGVSQGYRPHYERILRHVGIQRSQIIDTSIYNLVEKPLYKKGNEKTWALHPDKYDEVNSAIESRISAIKPTMIVVSCPAVLGVITELDKGRRSIEKTRGGVYTFKGLPTVITYPISAVNTVMTERDDGQGDDPEAEPYKVKSGSWVLMNDWRKISRVFHGKTRKIPPFKYSITRTIEDVKHVEKFLSECVLIASDIETKSTHMVANDKRSYRTEMTCMGYCGLHKSGIVRAFVIPFFDLFAPCGVHWRTIEDHVTAMEAVKRINANSAIKVLQNGTYDSAYMIRDRMPYENYLLDTQHMWHSMYPELPKRLDFITSILLDNYQYWKSDIKGIEEKDETAADTNMEKYWRYNALDCYNTLFDALFLLPTFVRTDAFKRNYESEFLASMSGLRMGMKGVKADFDRLREHKKELEAKAAEGERIIRIMTDDPQFNPGSPQQVCSLFYDFLGAKERDAKGRIRGPRSKTSRSTGTAAMKLIRTEHPLFRRFSDAIYAAKKPRKQISDICEKGLALQTNRFRYALNASGTTSWRYSAKSSQFWDGFNAQNITEYMRDWLVADEHFIMWDADFSQSDGWFVAHESQDDKMIDVMHSGKDTHAVHAAFFFKDTYENVVAGKKAHDPKYVDPDKGIRQLAKRVVHGANFQMAAFTLFVTMGKEAVIAAAHALGHEYAHKWSDEQLIQICGRLLRGYRTLYPRLTEKEWYREIKNDVTNNGEIVNWYGMRRKILGDPANPRTQREATAFYGQSGTAMNMNRALYELDYGYMPKTFRDGINPDYGKKPLQINGKDGLYLLLQVHDSFVGISDTRVPGWQEHLNNLLTVMQRRLIINRREFFVPAEMAVAGRWTKSALEWNPNNPPSLDDIHAA